MPRRTILPNFTDIFEQLDSKPIEVVHNMSEYAEEKVDPIFKDEDNPTREEMQLKNQIRFEFKLNTSALK